MDRHRISRSLILFLQVAVIFFLLQSGSAFACSSAIFGSADPDATVCAKNDKGTLWCVKAKDGGLNLGGATVPPSNTKVQCLPAHGTFFVYDVACPECGKTQKHFDGDDQNLPVDVRCGCREQILAEGGTKPFTGGNDPATAFAPIGKGMTWRLTGTNAKTGTIDVGCGYSHPTPNGPSECDPRAGDTLCTTQLPLLCFKPSQLPLPANVDNSAQNHKWSGGIVATTPPVAGNSASNPKLTTLADANAFCAQQFGPGWRVAEFHDGWGWYFQAYGGVGQPSQRFWVDINDQRSTATKQKGTCWY